MNWLKQGPELKLSSLKSGELKMPPVLTDLYYDLRDRRLLPLVALVIVGIVAIPVLIGGGSSEEEEASVPTPATAGALAEVSSAGSSRQLDVVESKPGLREYKKRLAGKPIDPFVQKFNGPQLNGAQLTHVTEPSGSGTTSSVSGSPESPSGAPESTIPPPSGAPSGVPGVPPGKIRITFFTYAIDVQISKSEATGSSAKSTLAVPRESIRTDGPRHEATPLADEGEPSVRHKVLPDTKLPGEKAPVVTYMGPSKHGNPLLLVSNKVKSVFGEQRCVSGDDSCQLMEVAVGYPVLLIYGEEEVHYKLTVLKMERVVTGHKIVDANNPTFNVRSQNFSK